MDNGLFPIAVSQHDQLQLAAASRAPRPWAMQMGPGLPRRLARRGKPCGADQSAREGPRFPHLALQPGLPGPIELLSTYYTCWAARSVPVESVCLGLVWSTGPAGASAKRRLAVALTSSCDQGIGQQPQTNEQNTTALQIWHTAPAYWICSR